MDWEFVSDDTDSISLHDCDISEYVFGEDILLIFENGFDVAAPMTNCCSAGTSSPTTLGFRENKGII